MNESITAAKVESWLARKLSAQHFLVGVVVGFAACCVAGRALPGRMPMRDFERFTVGTMAQSHYYPTALQLRALARRELPRDKIGVIIGGNSILYGMGQSAEDVWTRPLERELGDEYRVLNLALPGGAPTEYGQVVAEMMASQRRIIYVCNSRLDEFTKFADGTNRAYRHLFYDAQARGLLLPYPQRAVALARLPARRTATDDLGELPLQCAVNRWLSFNDLWHVFGYEAAFTIWSPKAQGRPWRPRRLHRDRHNLTPPQDASMRPEDIAFILKRTRTLSAVEQDEFEKAALAAVPPELRARMLVLAMPFNPRHVAKLDEQIPGFRKRHDERIDLYLHQLRACRFNAIRGSSELTADDFLDLNHLLAVGGDKLARDVAPAIRALAERLHYTGGLAQTATPTAKESRP